MAGNLGPDNEPIGVEYVVQHTSEITGMSWTHAGDGLLVSGKAGEIAMQEVPSTEKGASIAKPSRLPFDKLDVFLPSPHLLTLCFVKYLELHLVSGIALTHLQTVPNAHPLSHENLHDPMRSGQSRRIHTRL